MKWYSAHFRRATPPAPSPISIFLNYIFTFLDESDSSKQFFLLYTLGPHIQFIESSRMPVLTFDKNSEIIPKVDVGGGCLKCAEQDRTDETIS